MADRLTRTELESYIARDFNGAVTFLYGLPGEVYEQPAYAVCEARLPLAETLGLASCSAAAQTLLQPPLNGSSTASGRGMDSAGAGPCEGSEPSRVFVLQLVQGLEWEGQGGAGGGLLEDGWNESDASGVGSTCSPGGTGGTGDGDSRDEGDVSLAAFLAELMQGDEKLIDIAALRQHPQPRRPCASPSALTHQGF